MMAMKNLTQAIQNESNLYDSYTKVEEAMKTMDK